MEIRNTPTGVGKTASRLSQERVIQKHPHGRGEDLSGGGVKSEP